MRFQEFLVQLVGNDGHGQIGNDWVEFPDLTNFVEKYLLDAATSAIFGTSYSSDVPASYRRVLGI